MRFLGYDVEYADSSMEDDDIIRKCNSSCLILENSSISRFSFKSLDSEKICSLSGLDRNSYTAP